MNLLYLLNYVDAPVVKEKTDDHLILESIRNKVWNPVFTVGLTAFVLSMTLRGFFDQVYAVIPLALSTFILFSGIWILSANAMLVFDRNESKLYCIYKHLGYLQKIYVHPMSSIDEVQLLNTGGERVQIQLLKDDGSLVKVAERKDQQLLQNTAREISDFIKVPLKVA